MPDTRPPTMRAAFAQAVENLRLGYPLRHELYLSRLTPVSYAAGVLTVAAPDPRVRDLCALRLNRLLTNELAYTAGRPVAINYVLQQDGASC